MYMCNEIRTMFKALDGGGGGGVVIHPDFFFNFFISKLELSRLKGQPFSLAHVVRIDTDYICIDFLDVLLLSAAG